MLEIIPLILGPVSTNCYLIADHDSGEAAVIDPAWDGQVILAEAKKRGWKIGQLWYTHAHFDHFGGAAEIAKALNPLPIVALHPLEHDLWQNQGGAPLFGMGIDPGPEPMVDLTHSQTLRLGEIEFEVRHTPGHTPGHVVFYCAKETVLFSGDLIFRRSVGRTDLPGGDWEALVRSIREQVFTLPDETRLLSGHGEESTVGEEKCENPFVRA
ncbi:MAG TPA: MBL fold metallo-hydrolase [Anaerolineales bacterium]|jgi:glyoxylase-like metal-dependent hydrolase (beta-lactamase superfamily II)